MQTNSVADPGHAHGVYDPGHAHGGWTDAQGHHAHGFVAPQVSGIGTGSAGILGRLVDGDIGKARDGAGSLTLKDLITLISAAITLTVACGVFGTRLTVLEKEVASLRDMDKGVLQQVERLRKQVRRLEAHQQDDELLLDQVFILLRRPLPRRVTVE